MTRPDGFVGVGNGGAVSLADVPERDVTDLVEATVGRVARGGRVCAWFGVTEGPHTRIIAVVAHDARSEVVVSRSEPVRGAYGALTPRCPQAHLFERELCEQHGLGPEEHPWLKPVRLDRGAGPAVIPFFEVQGSEVHEVAVGPVHAGVIEPGHFRFQCAGEEVLHLEIALGFQHRGVEEAAAGGPHRATMSQMETVAGDSTIGHATAYAGALEALAGAEAPLRAQWLRAILLELERVANHVGDLGALAGDVAFLPTASACGKLRGDVLNATAAVAGNRFGRGLVRPGGCRRDLDADGARALGQGLRETLDGVERAVDWLWDAASVRARFETAGSLAPTVADEIGMVGPAARACGLVRDVRYDHPAGWHRFAQIPVAVWPGGDVLARARVRWLEAQRSGAFLLEQLADGPQGPARQETGALRPQALAVALVEGWRGEICHVALTDGAGRLARYKIVDPSFHNWTGLALAMRGQPISDFPLCNKSFNLSYCGFDL